MLLGGLYGDRLHLVAMRHPWYSHIGWGCFAAKAFEPGSVVGYLVSGPLLSPIITLAPQDQAFLHKHLEERGRQAPSAPVTETADPTVNACMTRHQAPL